MFSSAEYTAPLRGRDYWNEVCTPEYVEWSDWWGTLSYDDKLALCESIDLAYESHDNERITLMRMAQAWQDHHGIVKYKPEYQTSEARNVVRHGIIVTSTPTIQVELPSAVGDADAAMQLIWPDAPVCCDVITNFDEPTYYQEIKIMVQLGSHIALEGPPSVGKDTAVEQLAAEMSQPLVTIGGDGGFRTSDLKGTQQLINGTTYFEVGDYVAAAVNGWWVLITEVNAADPSALMYINRQLAAPYVVNLNGRSFPVHPNFRLFVSYNHGLVGTKPLPQSFKDRFFSVKIPFFTHNALHKRLIAMGMPDTNEYATVTVFGMAMWAAYESGLMRYQVTTRRLIDAVKLIKVGGYDVKKALRAAVLNSIDSPIEYKAAEQVLNNL